MRIGIDARFAVHKRRGIGNYTLSLILNLMKIDKLNQYILYVDSVDGENILPCFENFQIRRLSPSNYAVWEQVVLPKQAKEDSLDILHSTGNTAPIKLDRNIKLVTTIHDVMYMQNSNVLPNSASWYQRLGRVYRKYVVTNSIYRADKIISISDFSKQDILKTFPSLKAEDVCVIHEAASERFSLQKDKKTIDVVKQKMGICGNYILVLGAIDPRKNTERMIHVFAELKRNACVDEKLVIVGIPNWRKTQFVSIVQNLQCQDHIIFTDFVEEQELVALYHGATVFVYPSLYEGFGLPPLEAMACGVPVITSNVTSIPEITGDAAILVDPLSEQEMTFAIKRVVNNENLQLQLAKQSLLQSEKFSWEKLARETLQVYNAVIR